MISWRARLPRGPRTRLRSAEDRAQRRRRRPSRRAPALSGGSRLHDGAPVAIASEWSRPGYDRQRHRQRACPRPPPRNGRAQSLEHSCVLIVVPVVRDQLSEAERSASSNQAILTREACSTIAVQGQADLDGVFDGLVVDATGRGSRSAQRHRGHVGVRSAPMHVEAASNARLWCPLERAPRKNRGPKRQVLTRRNRPGPTITFLQLRGAADVTSRRSARTPQQP